MASSVHADKNRKRGAPLSCAECRRLKLRCSRVFPCASCVKKGCAAICPDGSLTTGRGNRFVLANTEVLHEKILVLSTRVRDLEVALSEAHQGRSGDTHPLLTPELLQLKRPLEREAPEAPRDQETEVAEVLDAVGSLSLTEHGHTRFYGTAANAWYLLQNEEGGGDEAESVEIALPSDIPWLGHGFPFTSASETRLHVRTFLLSQLPEHTKARHLVDIYYRHCGWMYTPLPETELYANVFSRIYDQTIAIDQDPTDSHRLAVLYMVFALGTLMDLDQPYLSTQSTQYYQLARAALSLDSVLENQSIPAIQALLLMCHFMFLSFRDGPRWALMGLVVKLAQGLGLHRDSGNWNLSAEETFKRRSLLWEIYVYDSWQSLTYGRPPSFANAFIDCQMPEPDPPTSADNPKDLEISYSAWKHRFASRCLSIVHEQAFGARTPSYKVIQQLDKKVKEWPVPPMLQVPGFGEAKTMELTAPPIELTMQRYIVFAIREITIFYLHRGFFARAIEDSPEDPLGSKYAPSVLAAYNSARTFVGLVKSLHSQHPKLTERHWFLFTHVFSCAIVLGSIAAKCPGMPFARTALTNLDSAYSLFEVVRENDRALKVLPTLQKLRNKALVVMNSYTGAGPLPSLRSSPGAIKEEDDAELAALRGKTRLVSRKSPSLPSSPHDSNSNGTPSPKSSPVQRYSMDQGHLTHDTIMIHGTPDHSNNWQVYSQPQENGYGPYYATPSTSQTQWSPETEYPPQPNHSPNLLMNPASFHAYEQFPMNQPSYIPSRSPLEPPGPPDVSSAWQSFIAQYDQPGMVG